MRWPPTSIRNARGSPQTQSAGRCGGPESCASRWSKGTLPKRRSCVAANTRIFQGPIRRTSPAVTASPDEAPARFARSTAEAEAMRRACVLDMIVGTSSRWSKCPWVTRIASALGARCRIPSATRGTFGRRREPSAILKRSTREK